MRRCDDKKHEPRTCRGIRPIRGTTLAHIDVPLTIRSLTPRLTELITSISLAELIVGEELHIDAIGQSVGCEALDEIIVICAAIGELRLVWQRGRQAQRHRRCARGTHNGGATAIPTSKDRRLTR